MIRAFLQIATNSLVEQSMKRFDTFFFLHLHPEDLVGSANKLLITYTSIGLQSRQSTFIISYPIT